MVELESVRNMVDPKKGPDLLPLENGHMDRFFKALSDRTRRSILMSLESREQTVSEIVGQFHLSQPTISRHLAVLREANLVTDRRQGQHVIYRLNMSVLADSLSDFIGHFRRSPWFL